MLIEDKFGLKDEEYWTDPWGTRKDVQRPLMQSGEEGFVIGTPATVALDTYDTFPVAILRVSKVTSTDKVDFRGTAIVAAMELNTYKLSAAFAFGQAAPPPPPPSGGTGGGGDSFSGDESAMSAEGHMVDLATLLQLPAERAEYLVALICLDQVSNQCRMKLVESAGYEDPAVDDFLMEFQAKMLGPPEISPEPGGELPNYEQGDDSPEIPAEPGIVMSMERVNALGAETQCLINASYRLPIRPHHVMKPAEGEGEPAPAGDETAIVPITLLLTGSVDTTPKVVELAVPTTEPVDTSGDAPVATGYFALDLCTLEELTSTPQTYFIYAFSGEVMAGPFPTAFVKLPEGWEAAAAELGVGGPNGHETNYAKSLSQW